MSIINFTIDHQATSQKVIKTKGFLTGVTETNYTNNSGPSNTCSEAFKTRHVDGNKFIQRKQLGKLNPVEAICAVTHVTSPE